MRALIACPDCPPVRDARALFFEQGFAENVARAFVPFVVTLVLVLLIVRAVERARKGPSHANG